jgi:hypothetical protein
MCWDYRYAPSHHTPDLFFMSPIYTDTQHPYPWRTPASLPSCFYIDFILSWIFTENGTEITDLEYLEVITVPYFKHLKIKFLSSHPMYIIYTQGLQSNISNQQRTKTRTWWGGESP